ARSTRQDPPACWTTRPRSSPRRGRSRSGSWQERHEPAVDELTVHLHVALAQALGREAEALIEATRRLVVDAHPELYAAQAAVLPRREGCLHEGASDAFAAIVADDAHAEDAAVPLGGPRPQSDVAPSHDSAPGERDEVRDALLDVVHHVFSGSGLRRRF